tara:strand:+ start:450 stop:635 length:186 start_codon:yes stop_codon:yes gene_type:complete
MPKYRVLTQYTVTEEMFVDAKNKDEAEELATISANAGNFEIIDEDGWHIYEVMQMKEKEDV